VRREVPARRLQDALEARRVAGPAAQRLGRRIVLGFGHLTLWT